MLAGELWAFASMLARKTLRSFIPAVLTKMAREIIDDKRYHSEI